MRVAVLGVMLVAAVACGTPPGSRTPAPPPAPAPGGVVAAPRPGVSTPASYVAVTVPYTFSATTTTEWIGDTVHEPRRTVVAGELRVTRRDPSRAVGELSLDTVVYTIGDAMPDTAVHGGAVTVADSELDALSCDRIGALARAALPALLPRVPDQLRADARWSDTVTTSSCTGRARGTTRVMSEYHVTLLTDSLARVERSSVVDLTMSSDSAGTATAHGETNAVLEIATPSRVLRSIDASGHMDFEIAVAGTTRRYRQTSQLSAHALP